MVIKLIGRGFVDNFKVAVFGHPVGQKLSGFEVVEAIDRADGVGIVVADIHRPDGNFLAFVVNIGLRAVQENAAPLVADGPGVGVAGGLFFLPALGAHIFTLAGVVAMPVGIEIPAIAWRALGRGGGHIHLIFRLRISHSDCGEM